MDQETVDLTYLAARISESVAPLRNLRLVVPYNPAVKCIQIDEQVISEVAILKQIARDCILNRPALVAQQRGQARIITELYE
jgi:dGTP triphosphohydrolase